MSVITARPVLVPTSETDLNSKSTTFQSRKRKLSQVEQSGKNVFISIPLSSNEAYSFSPLAVLPRSHVPLAWLNTNASISKPGPGYIFEAQIEAIKKWENVILVARLVPNGGLYAVEKATESVYIACPLHAWVTEKWCKDAVEGKITEPEIQLLLQSRHGHSRTASTSSNPGVRLPTPCSPKMAKNNRGALARISILTPKDSVIPLSEVSPWMEPLTDPVNVKAATSIPPQHDLPPDQENLNQFEAQPSEQRLSDVNNNQTIPQSQHTEASETSSRKDVLSADQIRQCYFETLYLSKTSLAFYAKGPLTRARGQVRSLELNDRSLHDVNDFYRQIILPTKKMDVKYKDSLHKIVQNFHLQKTEAEGSEKKMKRRKKKMKLGKDGIWTDEEEYILQWWNGRELDSSLKISTEAQAEELRKLISDLRTRETEMQLLLILEVMRLERISAHQSATAIPKHPDVKAESVEEESSLMLANTPQHNRRDLSGDLDTVVDRLCIWHTLGSEGIESCSEKHEGDAKSKDRLRDFCANVIIPFYAPKLPEQCKSLSRKLGGPEISPQRPRASSKPARFPGAAVKPKSQPAMKRTLERVLSEDQAMRHASPPVLSRSSTAPTIPNLKREPSEIFHRPMSRGGMHKSVSFSNREIDLVADARTHEAKKRKLDKLAAQKQELNAAIDALKKPNRSSAAKAFMDEIEQRSTKQQVHITATPRKERTKSVVHSEPEPPVFSATTDQESVIPSSTAKTLSSALSRSSAAKRAVLTAIHDTPSRDRYTDSTNLAVPTLIHSSRLTPTKTAAPFEIAATPCTSRNRSDLFEDHSACSSDDQVALTPVRMAKSRKPVLFTPLKKNDIDLAKAFRDAPEIPAEAGRAMDRVMGGKGEGFGKRLDVRSSPGNIYDQLGWNDDFDL